MKRIQTKNEVAVIRRSGWFLLCTYALLFLLFASGCNNKFFDPTQIGRFRPVPAVNVILDTLGVAEETPVAWEQAEDPKPEDTVVEESDYVFRPGDIVRIAIFELLQEGTIFANDYVVTETGKISIPEVGVVEAAGLTETQLEEQIRQILAPSILKEPSVVVTLYASQQRAFSILGDGVATPSRYVIPRYDYRLADAIATAGGVRQFNVSYIYVSRYAQKEYEAVGAPMRPGTKELEELELLKPEELTQPQLIEPQKLTEPEKEEWEVITPRVQRQWPQSRVVVTTSEMITDRELAQAGSPDDFGILSDGQRDWRSVRGRPVEPSAPETITPEPEEEAIKNEPVSVKDILKTLSERRTAGAQTDASRMVQEPSAEPSAPQPMVEMPSEGEMEEMGVEEMPALPEMPRREKINQRTGIRRTVRPSAGASPTGREWVGEETAEEVAPPWPGPTEEAKPGAEANIDAILRSLSERQRPQAGVGVEEPFLPLEERVAPLEEPVGQERMEERINVDEVLKTLSEQPRRERAGEAVGVEVAPEVPRRRIRVEEEGVPVPSSAKSVAPERAEEETGRIEWIFQDGKWVPVQVGPPKPVAPVFEFERGEELVSPLEERARPVLKIERGEGAESRLIRIPADKLLAGDQRYNIVIKPGDTIHVPVDVIGEFCIMGNVNNQGYINITGRPMTLKMAIAAAGGLGPLAWPKTCEVVRRISKKKEEIVLVDLDKIASGEQPDFFIRPNDLINVGTHPTSIWRYRLRNAFTATYGMWLVYDRNFAYTNDYYGTRFLGM